MLYLIKACETESELDFLQESFVLTEEQKEAVLQQRIIFWTNAMAEDIARGIQLVLLMTSWKIGRRINGANLTKTVLMMMVCCELEQLPETSENQMVEGNKRNHASDDVPSKRQRSEEYFTIKSAKQVNVRNFRTTGTH
jgi:hypothetical protein